MFGQARLGLPATQFRTLLALGAFLTWNHLLIERAHCDLQIAGYQDRMHDRFYTGSDRVFIGTGFNWSGVGRIADATGDGTNWKFATMISDNYFITTNHNHPNRGDDPSSSPPPVRFYRTDDPNGEFWESPIALSGSSYVGNQVGATDLWVGKLANTPPSWVTRYSLAKRHEATNYLSYTDNDLFVFGQDSPRSFTSVRLGRNEIDTVNSVGDYQWSYEASTGFGVNEAQTVSGDSGAPSFFTVGTMPVLAGVHTRTNFDTGISANLAQIAATVGEPISVSTGLVGDVDGDFRVSPRDQYVMLGNWGKSSAQYHQGDISGNGRIGQEDIDIWVKSYGQRLFAPSDFDRDGDVDGADLATIGDNWSKTVSSPFRYGDASGNSFVNFADIEIFDGNQNRAYFGPLPAPLSPITGDLDGNGMVNEIDSNTVAANLNRRVTPGTLGDFNFNGLVDFADLNVVMTAIGDSFGDINGDHEIGPADFVVLANNWNRVVTGGRLNGDMNADGWVNSLDASVLFAWWGVNSSGAFGGISIPEPGSVLLGILALFSVASVRRSRQRL